MSGSIGQSHEFRPARRSGKSPFGWALGVLLAGLLVLDVWLIAYVAREMSLFAQLQSTGQEATGVIARLDRGQGKWGLKNPSAIVEWKGADAKPLTAKIRIALFTLDRLKPRDKVQLKFLPDNPDVVSLKDDVEAGDNEIMFESTTQAASQLFLLNAFVAFLLFGVYSTLKARARGSI